MILQPQQFTVYSDGTYSGLLEIQEIKGYQNTVTGLSLAMPKEYNNIAIQGKKDKAENLADSLALLFHNQLAYFPQEKIHLHTDKPYYISGERIWFRAHLADAATHVLESYSRYVYVELINPLDTIVTRVKIRQQDGAYHGCLLIPEIAPEGDYTLRAYTTFMRSQDEDYFCTKPVRIGDPQASAVHTETKFAFEDGNWLTATFRFSHVGISSPLVPKSAKVTVNDGKPMNLEVDNDGRATFRINLPATSRKRIILLETMASNYPYRQFIQVPVPDDDFDVAFFPEGGSVMQGARCKIAFKAMKSNGQSTDITGVIYDQSGAQIQKIKSGHLGMGYFENFAEKGKTYYAICTTGQGQSKRFNLPAATDRGYALSVSQLNENIFVTVLQPAGNQHGDELYLLAHTHGMVHFAELWDHEKNIASFRKEQFPSGVLHFILFDAGLHPVSERLVFINNNDQAQAVFQTDQEQYSSRSLVQSRITISDRSGQPLIGSFSVSVTSDKEVMPDSTSNILTQLLLTSDLYGYIENPAYYFQNTPASAYALNLLMCTQGWRRYNIAELSRGRFSQPTFPIEIGAEISGTVKRIFLGKPVENIDVSVVSHQGDYFDNTITDKDGRFYFYDGELPDTTRFLVSAMPAKGVFDLELIMDMETFPERTLPADPFRSPVGRLQLAIYADKAEQQYISEGGIRLYHIPEVTITAERKPPRKSLFYDMPSNSITEEELDKIFVTNVYMLLSRFPGVRVVNKTVTIRNAGNPFSDEDGNTIGGGAPLLLLDDMPLPIEWLDNINVFDIAQIDVLKDASNTILFGTRGTYGVIVIFTKGGGISNKAVPKPLHIKTILPLGYQTPVEFYAPKYDTPEKRNSSIPDLRTTIHWQPVVQTDSLGVASFEFYTADEATTYTAIIEGLANDGTIIRHEEKLWRQDER